MKNDICVKLAIHAIGLDNKCPYKRHGKLFYKPYRNYFSISENCDAFEDWKTMEISGFAKSNLIGVGKYMFWLTRKGLDWLGEQIGVKIYNEEDN